MDNERTENMLWQTVMDREKDVIVMDKERTENRLWQTVNDKEQMWQTVTGRDMLLQMA